jgi:hypothetical protein
MRSVLIETGPRQGKADVARSTLASPSLDGEERRPRFFFRIFLFPSMAPKEEREG